MLFLFTDVEEDDAPTRIKVGSHLEVPAPARAGGRGRPHLPRAGRALRPRVGTIRSRWRPVPRETSISVTRSWCTRRSAIAGRPRSSWRSRRFNPRVRSRSIVPDGDYSPVERAIRIGLGLQRPMIKDLFEHERRKFPLAPGATLLAGFALLWESELVAAIERVSGSGAVSPLGGAGRTPACRWRCQGAVWLAG